MIEDKIIETEYKKLYKHQIKWAKHWASRTAHRAHSSTQFMEDPARKTLDFCLTIENKNTSYIAKIEQIKSFYENCDNEELIKQRFYNSYYKECLNFLKSKEVDIKNGVVLRLPKMPRA